MTAFERDTLIRVALTPDDTVQAPAGLGDDIGRAVRTTPQRRPWLAIPRLGWPAQASPTFLVLLLTMLLVLLLGSLIVLSRLPVAARLATYHGDAERSGLMPGPGPLGDPVVAWEANRHGAMGATSMPLVADGRVFVADDSGSVAALDESDGDELWEVAVGSPTRGSSVWVAGLIVVGSDSGTVVALRAADGTEVWRFLASGPVSASLAAVGEIVYVGSEDGYLYALDAASGELHWSVPAGGPITSGPAIFESVIYVGAVGGRFSAIEAASQAVNWSAELGPGGVTTPAVTNETIYAGRGFEASQAPHDLVALAVADGSQRSVFESPSGRQVFVGAVGEDLLYAVSEDNNVYALDPATGAVIWWHTTDGRVGALAGLVDGVLYVSSTDGTVRALDAATGALRWSLAVEGEPTMPAVINGRVIVGTTLGKVVAIAGSSDSTP